MKKSVIVLAVLGFGVIGSAQAASFLNGGFENGDLSGWTIGSGTNTSATGTSTGALALDPSSYTSTSNWKGAVTSAGTDPITGLSLVKYGDHAVRVNNSTNDYSVNVISQSVSNYDGTSINFAWAAVLQSSHGITDSDIFGLKITNTSTNTVLYNATYSSANTNTAPSGTFSNKNGWYYNDWTEVSLSVTQGDNYLVQLLAADCPYGAHAGYVYLDGFGTVQGGGGDNGSGGTSNVPEPASIALVGVGMLGALLSRRRKYQA